jgi:hypothetical protein
MVQQLRHFHDDAALGLHGIGRVGRVERRCRLRLRGRERRARDIVFGIGRYRLSRRVRLGHLRAHARHEQMHRTYLFAVDPAVEHARIANADLAGAVAQWRVAPNEGARGAGNAPVDAVFAAVLDERLGGESNVVELGRRHMRTGDAQLLSQRVRHPHQCAIEHLRGVMRGEPVRQRAGPHNEAEQRCRQRTQQMQAQADRTVAALGRCC